MNGKRPIAVVGLGYVGLPLAAAFGKLMPTVGFDINPARVDELRAGRDCTLEVDPGALAEATQLSYSSESGDIAACPRSSSRDGASMIVWAAMLRGRCSNS